MPARRGGGGGGSRGKRARRAASPDERSDESASDEDVFEDVRDADGFEDEEIDEDEAFDDEDEARWGEAFARGDDEAWDEEASDFDDEGADADGGEDDVDANDDLNALMDSEDEADAQVGRSAAATRAKAEDEDEDDLRELLSDEDEADDERRESMLNELVGKRKRVKLDPRYKPVKTEVVKESPFAVPKRVLEDQPKLTLKDVMAALGENALNRETVKRLNKISKTKAIDAPLARPIQQRVDRKVAYAETSKDISKYQDIVKENREKRTLKFAAARDEMQRKDTLGALTADFLPKSEIEKEIAQVLKESGHSTGKEVARGELLEMNHLDAEDIKARQAKLAKMRAVLFYHEQKAKRLKAIKSKAYHRINRKGELKVIGDEEEDGEGNTPEERREYLRAQERMLLRHKNTSRWAKRAIKKGIAHLAGTREKLQEQLRIGQQLKEKIEGTRTTTSDGEESTDAEDSDDDSDAPEDPATERKRRMKAKAAALKALEDGAGELPGANDSLFKLPFMARAMEKRRAASQAEAREMLDELDAMDRDEQFDLSDSEDDEWDAMTIRAKRASDARTASVSKHAADGEDSDEAHKDLADDAPEKPQSTVQHKSKKPSASSVTKAKPIGEISDAARRMREKAAARVAPPRVVQRVDDEPTVMLDEERDFGTSNEDLMRRAFAGDDIEAEFEKEKLEDVNAELPDADGPKNLPGWGNWADNQKTPKWMIEAEKKAKAERTKALKNRRDAKLKHVVISEKFDKKAAQFNVESLPHGFSTKATYEGTMRQPLGPDVNTPSMFAKLNAPKILKPTGSIIKPLKLPKQKANTKSKGR